MKLTKKQACLVSTVVLSGLGIWVLKQLPSTVLADEKKAMFTTEMTTQTTETSVATTETNSEQTTETTTDTATDKSSERELASSSCTTNEEVMATTETTVVLETTTETAVSATEATSNQSTTATSVKETEVYVTSTTSEPTTTVETTSASTTASTKEENPNSQEASASTTDSPKEEQQRLVENEELKATEHFQADTETVIENFQFSVVKNQTTQEFIASVSDVAQEVAWRKDLYASVMIAQAILETGSGNSQLSQAPNYNLFGIKGTYQGNSVNFATQEDNGQGALFTINAGFRRYPSYKESFEDYAELLTGGISGNASFYAKTWKSNSDSYEKVTAFLTGRYATDTSYGQKLNALIRAYELTQYDAEPGKVKKNTDAGKKTEKETETSKDTASVDTATAQTAKADKNQQAGKDQHLLSKPINGLRAVYQWLEESLSFVRTPAKDISGQQNVDTTSNSSSEMP